MNNDFQIQSYNKEELNKLLHYLDGPLRLALKENIKVLDTAEIKEGSRVLDLGCGSGFLSLEAAKIVGDSGEVVAVDARQEMLDVLEEKAKKQGVRDRIKTVRSYVNKLQFEDNKFDAVVMSYLIHENKKDANEILKESVRVLRKGGKIVISDFTKLEDPIKNKEIEAWYKNTDPESDEGEVHFCLTLNDYEELLKYVGLNDVKSEVWIEFQGIIQGIK